jgi:hypothetical protein
MKDLDTFLKEQQAGLFDSSGQFTIAADKALEKLAHSQLPKLSFWILKVMQFATSWEVLAAEVSFGRRVSRVQLELPHPISVGQIQKGLGSVEPLDDPALESLVTALRAAGAMSGRRFVLELISPERVEHLFWDGERLSFKESNKSSDRTSLVLEITSSGPSGWSAMVDVLGVSRRAEELELLSKQAFTVPFPLVLDGRMAELDYFQLPDKFQQPILCDFTFHEAGFALPHLIVNLVRNTFEGEAGTKIRQKYSQVAWRASAFWNLSYNYSLEHKVLRLSPGPVRASGKSHLHWLRDGVIVDRERLHSDGMEFSLDLFVDGSDCEADLGGLKLRRTPHFENKRAWVRELLKHIVTTTNKQLPTATRLTGRAMGGWDSVVMGTTYLPINRSVKYPKPTTVSKSLSETTGFRKKLLRQIRQERLAPLELP